MGESIIESYEKLRVVAGSLCNGRLQESFAAKYNDCKECDFYKSVKIEEGLYLEMTIVMLNKLRKEGLQLTTVASQQFMK